MRSLFPARTTARPGVGGTLRQTPEDFIVVEAPRAAPTGDGEYLSFLVRKRNKTTALVANMLARALGTRATNVAYAGRKDRNALTTQSFTVWVGEQCVQPPSRLGKDVEILRVERTDQPLHVGDLAGNRFIITIRDVEASRAEEAGAVLRSLQDRGAPYSFGAQRFGARSVNHLVGAAMARRDWEAALCALLGAEGAAGLRDFEARRAFAAGSAQDALAAWPRGASPERQVIAALAQGSTPKDALLAMAARHRFLFISALQAAVFNSALSARIAAGTWRTPVKGDIAVDLSQRFNQAGSSGGAAMPVGTADACPTGPMWGPDMPRASGAIDAAEVDVLLRLGVTVDNTLGLADIVEGGSIGVRRPLRMPVFDACAMGGEDKRGSFIRCEFTLPPGGFATIVLREVMGDSDACAPA